VLVRPEWVVLDGTLAGTVIRVRYRGGRSDLELDTPAGRLQAVADGDVPGVGEEVTWSLRRWWRSPGAAQLP